MVYPLSSRSMRVAHGIRALACEKTPTAPLVFDAETTMEGPGGDPAPFGPKGAKGILWAYKQGDSDAFWSNTAFHLLSAISTCDLMVAHNIKFDWQHLKKSAIGFGIDLPEVRKTWPEPLAFWDTSVAEYILTAQTSKFVSLAEVATKYGVGKKGDVLAEYIAAGMRSQDVPITQLAEYARQDVEITHKVMLKQWEQADFAQRILIMLHSQVAVIFAEAEDHGLSIDMPEAVRRRDTEQGKEDAVKAMFKEVMSRFVLSNTWHPTLGVDVASLADVEQFNTPRALSMVMFGLPQRLHLEGALPVPVGRTKKASVGPCLRLDWAVLDPQAYGAAKHSDGNSYLVNETILQKIIDTGPATHAQLAEAVLAARAAGKKSNTYYQGLIEAQTKYGDDTIHHKLNVTATSTGRTSSSNPNSQNQPEEVKEIFLPPPGHVFCEFDFKQLEVWGLAQLSQDLQLQADLKAGVDIHFETGKAAGMWKVPAEMAKDTRRKVKSVVFGLIYGGGKKTLAEQSGLDESAVGDIITAFYARYRGVAEFHKGMCDEVKSTREGRYLKHVTDLVVSSENGSKRSRVMRVIAPGANTGRMYAFPGSNLPASAKPWQSPWSPTNIKNYPVQGFATGDVVPLALVMLDAALPHGAQIVTAVHDAALQSVKDCPEIRTAVNGALKKLPQMVADAAEHLWGLEWSSAPGITVEWKRRWGGKPELSYEV